MRELSLKKHLRSDLFLRLLCPCLFIFMDKEFWHTEYAYVVSEKIKETAAAATWSLSALFRHQSTKNTCPFGLMVD